MTYGRYRWRYDNVLSEIASIINVARREKRTVKKGPTYVGFVRPGEKAAATSKKMGLLATVNDW